MEAHEDEIDVLRAQPGQHETPASQTATPRETEVLALQPKLAKPVEPGKPVGQRVDADKAQEIVKRTAKRTNCSPVWHWEGKGENETGIAKLLNFSVQAVQLCDEQIGKKR